MPTVYDCLTCEDHPHFDLHVHLLDFGGYKIQETWTSE